MLSRLALSNSSIGASSSSTTLWLHYPSASLKGHSSTTIQKYPSSSSIVPRLYCIYNTHFPRSSSDRLYDLTRHLLLLVFCQSPLTQLLSATSKRQTFQASTKSTIATLAIQSLHKITLEISTEVPKLLQQLHLLFCQFLCGLVHMFTSTTTPRCS